MYHESKRGRAPPEFLGIRTIFALALEYLACMEFPPNQSIKSSCWHLRRKISNIFRRTAKPLQLVTQSALGRVPHHQVWIWKIFKQNATFRYVISRHYCTWGPQNLPWWWIDCLCALNFQLRLSPLAPTCMALQSPPWWSKRIWISVALSQGKCSTACTKTSCLHWCNLEIGRASCRERVCFLV